MAEAELNALKKLEANKSCANCDAYNKFGHGNVCEKFRTFVCSNCKSAHQSFSHRVKSVTMSNWSKDDVDALRDSNGGGNAAAKRVWLGRWDETRLRKPHEGDHVDVYKRFIDKVYNDRAFYDDDATATATASATPKASSSPSTGGGSSRRVNGSSSSRRAAAEADADAASAAPNLLDFSSPVAAPVASAFAPATFDAFASPTNNAGGADAWGAFASAPAPAPVSAASSNDAFGAFTSAAPSFAASFDAFGPPTPVTTAPSASFDPFAPSNTMATVSASSSSSSSGANNFDPFGASMSHAPVASSSSSSSSSTFGFGHAGAMAPPPMMAPTTHNFTAFDALAAPPPNMGMAGMSAGMGMNMGMGMQNGMPRGPGMMPNGMPMQMGMGMAPMPHGMMGGGSGFGVAAPPMMMTSQSAYGGVRPLAHAVSRDPFAGLGIPHN